MDNKVKKRVQEGNISQRFFEFLSELVLNNKDTTDFILDWEYGFDRLDEKRMMIL